MGEASRTVPMASTAPTNDAAPICPARPPTSRTTTRPKGMAMRMAGSTETEARNQAWSTNSRQAKRPWNSSRTVARMVSSTMA